MYYMKSILPTSAIPIPIPKKKKRRDNRIHNRPLEPIELELTGFASGGRAIGHHNDGRIAFVEYGIPGEHVIAEITNSEPNFIEATAVLVTKSSPYRVESPCVYFGQCGGCQLQHIDYDHQLQLKTDVVANQLIHIGNFSKTEIDNWLKMMIGSVNSWNYRNHMRFTVRRDGQIGFMQRGTHRFLRINECKIASPRANDLLNLLQDRTMQTQQISIRVAENTDDFLIQPHLKWRPRTKSNRPSSGQRSYYEQIGEHDYRVSAGAFFQVNTKQAEVLVRLVTERVLEVQPNKVIDAYSGVGTFAAQLAPEVEEIITIEFSSAADGDASINLQDYENITRIEGTVESAFQNMDLTANVLIIDPPRSGLDKESINTLINSPIERIVYISCDPGTLARDLRLLVDGSFEIIDIQPLDMFPHTQHIECVTTLEKQT